MTQVTQTQSENRDKMLQRVLNLRAKASNDASSESEMNSALSLCAKLMDAYNIEEAELALAEADGRIELEIVHKESDSSILKGRKQKHKIVNVLSAISTFTETKVVMSTYSGKITFTGHRPDTEFANYLVAVIREALDNEFENYKRSVAGRIGYGAKTSFQNAMASRVSQRLYKMADERDEERKNAKEKAESLKIESRDTGSSTALIVSEIAEQKAKEVFAEFKKANPRLRTYRSSYRSTNGTAHGAGKAAGDRMNLGRAISKNSSQKAIA